MARKDILPKQFYKRGIFYLLIAGLALVGVLTTVYFQNIHKTDDSSKIETAEVKTDLAYVTYAAVPGVTSLAQLKQANSTVQTVSSSYGDYVDAINGLKGGTDGKYWSFYIDGTLASVGAGSYTQNGGEKIEWKFENLQQ